MPVVLSSFLSIMTPIWHYNNLIDHLKNSFESCKTFSSLAGDFVAIANGAKNQKISLPPSCRFTKVISMKCKWKAEVSELSKTWFAYCLWEPYLLTLAHTLLKILTWDMFYAKFLVKYMFMFEMWSKKLKMTATTATVFSAGEVYNKAKPASKIKKEKK